MIAAIDRASAASKTRHKNGKGEMDLKLKGRRALVTGSSSGGIGEAIARMLAQEGCTVVVHGRNRERAEKVAADINAAGVAIGSCQRTKVPPPSMPPRAPRSAETSRSSSTMPAAARPAAISADRSTVTPEEWISNINANLLSSVRLCLHAVPDMVTAKWGRVINISSAVAVQPNNLGADYSGAKAALNNFTDSLAGSLKGVGVTVNTVSPGIIIGDSLIRWGRKKYDDPNMTMEEIGQRMAEDKMFELPPVGRLGNPADVALVVCMLASPLSGFVTGANYRVDGGQIRSV